ncbi:MAG: HD-GYP domain-containing protein [Polyangiales bacterium]
MAPFGGMPPVLLVGLDTATSAVVEAALAGEGYDMIHAASVEDAVVVLRSKVSSLVLWDSGKAAPQERLWSLLEAQRGAAIIVLSDAGDVSQARRVLRRGAFACVNPANPFELVTQLYSAQLRQTPTRPGVAKDVDHLFQSMAPYQITDHLALACLARDAETGSHVARVGQYSSILARAMGFSEEQAELIAVAATTHDVGKLGVPEKILNKPGRLTESEFETMKQHTVIGAAILAGTENPMLKLAERIALEHHERWDGAGYPNGLVGDETILEARIVGIADVYDALVHNRVYKKAWPESRVLKLLLEQRGTQFDPRVVDAFMSVLPEIQRARRRLEDAPAKRAAA